MLKARTELERRDVYMQKKEPGGEQSTPFYRLSECLFYLVYLRGSLALFFSLAEFGARSPDQSEIADLQQQLSRNKSRAD